MGEGRGDILSRRTALFVEITFHKPVPKFSQMLKRDATSFSKYDMNFLLSESDMIISRPVSKEQNKTVRVLVGSEWRAATPGLKTSPLAAR